MNEIPKGIPVDGLPQSISAVSSGEDIRAVVDLMRQNGAFDNMSTHQDGQPQDHSAASSGTPVAELIARASQK